jgi:hypothetical protein
LQPLLSCGQSNEKDTLIEEQADNAIGNRYLPDKISSVLLSPQGPCWGKLEGVRLLGILREKENAYLGSFSWTQGTLKIKSVGHLELQQRTGLPGPLLDFVAQLEC